MFTGLHGRGDLSDDVIAIILTGTVQLHSVPGQANDGLGVPHTDPRARRPRPVELRRHHKHKILRQHARYVKHLYFSPFALLHRR